MNPREARLLVHLYPRPWRDRYGMEFEEFLQATPRSFGSVANVIWSAAWERVSPTIRQPIPTYPLSVFALAKMPSAFLPLAMSLAALAMLGAVSAIIGLAPEPDEGPTAHMWQLLMGAQIPLVMFFALKWLPRAPKQALCVIGLQAAAVLAAMAPVFLLGL